jgi:predicted porin
MQYGIAVTYGQGSWWAGYAQHRVRGNDGSINPAAPTSNLPRLRQQTMAAAYDFGSFRLGGGVNIAQNDASGTSRVDRRNWTLSAYVPILPNHLLRALYGRATDRAATNRNISTVQVGYQYLFSKRTSLYAAYGLVDNDSAAAVTLLGSLGTYAPGSQPRSLITGILHTF